MAKKKLSRAQEQQLDTIMTAADSQLDAAQNGDPIQVPLNKGTSRAAEIAATKRLRNRGLDVDIRYQAGQSYLILTPTN